MPIDVGGWSEKNARVQKAESFALEFYTEDGRLIFSFCLSLGGTVGAGGGRGGGRGWY